MTYEQKLAKILEYARDMEDAGLPYPRMQDSIFSSGGMARKLFTTVEDRTNFIDTPEYREVREILGRALKSELR